MKTLCLKKYKYFVSSAKSITFAPESKKRLRFKAQIQGIGA